MPDVPDLPTIPPGHAPLDVCHKSSSGVAIHLMPGCECNAPTQTIPAVKDKDGRILRDEHDIVVPGHVNVSDSLGKMSAMPLSQARTAGLIH